MDKHQREYYLNEQIKAIHKELGRKDDKAELDDLKTKIAEAGMTEEAAEKAISINSSSVDALLMLGISERQAKHYDTAEKTLKQANKLAKGGSADVHWNLALLYVYNFKRYKLAADELELYLKTQPNTEKEEMVRKLIKQYREIPDEG